MKALPDFELLDENSSRMAAESNTVRSFMDRLSTIARASENKESAVSNIVSEAYASVGFGPMLAVLKAYAA